MFGIFNVTAAPLNLFDLIGAVVMLSAVAYSFIADEQLRNFKKDPSNHEKTIDSGLWAYSRHPNYLGEVSTWWGLYLFALASGTDWWWTGIGALAITLLFVFASIPLMEERMLATRSDYGAYRGKVSSSLLPKFRRS
jgi:steroid 5-alpha reductase family enzyme